MPQMSSRRKPEFFWRRLALRKLLNIRGEGSDYTADPDDGDDFDSDSDSVDADVCPWPRFTENKLDEPPAGSNDGLPRLRRRNSETFRAQYITTKELRICAGTWNVGGKVPPDDIDIDDWIDINEPADIYVIGLQEVVPLNAGIIFGAENSRQALKWENLICETLDRIRPAKEQVKCFSDPPSPSGFKPFDDVEIIQEEALLEIDSDIGEQVHPLDEKLDQFNEVTDSSVSNFGDFSSDDVKPAEPVEEGLKKQLSSPKRLNRCLGVDHYDGGGNDNESGGFAAIQKTGKLTRMLSGTERIGLCWPEPPLDLLSQHVLEKSNSFKSTKSFKDFQSFKTFKSFKSIDEMLSGLELLSEVDLESLMKRKRRSQYMRIVSKQMVGIFLTVWVRRSLRRHVQNLKLSTVGVGVMGYIGNKGNPHPLPWLNSKPQIEESRILILHLGSVSVSMSIYQTLFCFVCTHLAAGEKVGDELRRNADVQEIHKRTRFHSISSEGLPRTIYDHEKVIWLGDLNYRINLSYEKVREFISRKEWSKLIEKDQLMKELRKGRTFDGWSEGTLNFAPTYKYEADSGEYYGEDPKVGRRTPSWCDRILSYGKGMKQLSYRRIDLKFSDHRPVTAVYMAEVEIFVPRKLQRALTFTDAEVENQEVLTEMSAEYRSW